MIFGTVNARLESVIPVTVFASGGPPREVQAVVDTGYSGVLSLPPEIVENLQLMFDRPGKAVLANGVEHECRVYWGFVNWHGQQWFKPIHCIPGTPLIGTAFLRGSQFSAEFLPGGQVHVERLTQ